MKIYLLTGFIILFSLLNTEVLFNLEDEPNDDYGNGSVIYPDNPMFDDPIFDLISFEFSERGEIYILDFTFAAKIKAVDHTEFQYSYDLPDDFILPLIHVYIDKDHMSNSGFTETILGTNIRLDPESNWEKAVVIASMPERYSGELERLQPEIYRSTVVSSPVLSKNKKVISASVPKGNLGEINEDWGFTVLVMSQDFSQTIRKNIYIREVNSTASQFNFGGGDSGITKDYDPNVIDMLVPLGKDQKFILNNYDKEAKKYASVPAVYPYRSSVQGGAKIGEVKQVTDEKVVINLGSDNGILKGTRLMIDSKVVVIAEDVFPQLTIAVFTGTEQWQDVSEGMSVTIIKE